MANSLIYKLALLALLPVVAAAIYIKGQRYDPALIKFKPLSEDAASITFPREIEGFSMAGQPRRYNRENLYEYINGHAEYFIGAGFVSLLVGEYTKKGSEKKQPDAAVDVYDMGKDIYAFGIIADESKMGYKEIKLGAKGYKSLQGISFIKGRYYVKISSFAKDAPLIKIAEAVEKNISEKPDAFSAFSRFPALGEVIGTRFIKEAYRGLDFLPNVLEREYRVKSKRIQVFLVTGNEKEMEKLGAAFFDFFKKTDVKYQTVEKYNKRFYKIIDPYEGDWYLLLSKDAMFGIYGASDDDLVRQFSDKRK